MVVIRKYSLLLPAQLAKLELGSQGIDSVILDESIGSLAPCFTMGSGIRLAVAEEDEDRADVLLKNMKSRNSRDLAPAHHKRS
ncbi:MAG: DUF2007 domain-containing protein [Verrucomicrobiae bacterium]|nr:DUF2007 domain-containing protein [Verrucomicrobiae bacterium]NNJ86453.1 hypothetical protein [Akkermansiaceae bacterium]